MAHPASTSVKTAIITGGCSGIGLALARDLLAKTSPKWRVILADINTAAYNSISSTLDPARHVFIHADVSGWTEHLALFEEAYTWSNGRIDFLAANAGINDKEGMLQPYDPNADPAKPNLKCLEIGLLAVFYGLTLFIHFSRKTALDLGKATDSTPFNPKMVITASMAGQYPFFISPQYTAAKHGCVGLARTAAPALLKHENIALNCVMPGFVATPVIPPGVVAQYPNEHVTLMSTVLRAFNELIDESGKVKKDGKSQGEDQVVKSGCTVECSVDELFYRRPVEFANASQEWVTDQSREEGILGRAMKEMRAMMLQGQNATILGKTGESIETTAVLQDLTGSPSRVKL